MLADRLKPFKIRKPFDKFWERLENEDGATINISKFNKFCDEYEMVVVDRIHSVNEDVEIDDMGLSIISEGISQFVGAVNEHERMFLTLL